MAVINSQLGFSNSLPSHGKISSFINVYSFGMNLKVVISSLGLITTVSYFHHCILYLISWFYFTKSINYQDYLSSHARFFGNNFRQDANFIYITKSDLPLFDSKPNNTAESLFVALLLRALIYEANDLLSLIYIYRWRTYFVVAKKPVCVNILVIEVNVPAKYKYVNVEIINANSTLTPSEL
ncbi:hypothetical protein [Scytonema sp. PCC 10023]|uniref:hypothetical protein n=1 Tax=Scytonema sp. PCC 10023 TaxID=1680591 RepID=UPI0039C6D004